MQNRKTFIDVLRIGQFRHGPRFVFAYGLKQLLHLISVVVILLLRY